MSVNTSAIILAAGKGTRMKSDLPKVLHQVMGKPIIRWVVDNTKAAGVQDIVVIVGQDSAAIKEELGSDVMYAVQEKQLGTGHAVLQGEKLLSRFEGNVLILCGDVPLLSPETLKELICAHEKGMAQGTVLSTLVCNPKGYGRIVRDKGHRVMRIVEEADASSCEKEIREINTGTYCFEKSALFTNLKNIADDNNQGEYYLTDVIEGINGSGGKVETLETADPDETIGINNRIQLAEATKYMKLKILQAHMLSGVTVIDPQTTFVDPECSIDRDVILQPFTIIKGKCQIGRNSMIGPGTRMEQAIIGEETVIDNSTLIDCKIGNNVVVGPYSFIRPGTVIGNNVKVGAFCEVKNTTVSNNSKVPHLSYMGDAIIGENVNIGAGTITCNYDGYEKHKTNIGDDVFIGSNTNFVSPVNVGRGAVIGAGSTITKDVPDNSLAVAREKQTNKKDWAIKRRKKPKQQDNK